MIEFSNPSTSINNINFPLLAPLWSSWSHFQNDTSSIVYGYYDASECYDENVNQVVSKLVNDYTVTINESSSFVPDNVHLITWKRLRPSSSSDQEATFQLVIASSTQGRFVSTYAVFVYEKDGVNWSQESIRDKNVLIGYSNGALNASEQLKYTNPFSKNSDIDSTSTLNLLNQIDKKPGNTGIESRIKIRFNILNY